MEKHTHKWVQIGKVEQLPTLSLEDCVLADITYSKYKCECGESHMMSRKPETHEERKKRLSDHWEDLK